MLSRQDRLYIHRINIHNPLPLTPGELGLNDVEELSYPTTPSYTNVPCYKENAPATAKGKFYGRRDIEDTVSLIDLLHVKVDVDIQPNARVKLTTAGSTEEINTWWTVTGDPRVQSFFANKKIFYVKSTTAPRQL
mgnify:CR=1 FL=1